MKPVVFGVRGQISLPGGISARGRMDINDLLIREYGYPYYDGTYEPVTRSGRLAKRVASWYFKERALKVDDKVKESIGNILNTESLPDLQLEYDFENDIKWPKGTFGDWACFLNENGGYTDYTRSIMQSGGYAFRLYEEGKGMARCWIMQGYKNPWLYAVNGYWKGDYANNGTDHLPKMATMLEGILGVRSKKVALEYTGGGPFYLNGGRGYVLYDEGNAPPSGISHYLSTESKPEFCHCHRCGDTGHYLRAIRIETRIGIEDLLVCEDCKDSYQQSYVSGNYVSEEDAYCLLDRDGNWDRGRIAGPMSMDYRCPRCGCTTAYPLHERGGSACRNCYYIFPRFSESEWAAVLEFGRYENVLHRAERRIATTPLPMQFERQYPYNVAPQDDEVSTMIAAYFAQVRVHNER